MTVGKLVIILGPEGGGKRRLLTHARKTMLGQELAIFPRRYVSGPASDSDEMLYRLDERTFVDWVQRDFFALYWSDHCCDYGVGQEIDAWMDAGLNVVVVGDAGLVEKARVRYPSIQAVIASPGEAVLAQWLTESKDIGQTQRDSRLAEARRLDADFQGAPRIWTNQSIDHAGAQLLSLLGRGRQDLKVA